MLRSRDKKTEGGKIFSVQLQVITAYNYLTFWMRGLSRFSEVNFSWELAFVSKNETFIVNFQILEYSVVFRS